MRSGGVCGGLSFCYFYRVAMFVGGAAAADFPKQPVKAVRITVTEDQAKTWLAVQGLILR